MFHKYISNLEKSAACVISVEIAINKNFSLKTITFIINLKSITNIKIKENFEFRKKVKKQSMKSADYFSK